MTEAVLETHLDFPNKRRGKVRDLYELQLAGGEEALLIIATDRVSAFDVVMANGLPGKGVLLTQISRFWFEMFGNEIDHHLISTDVNDIPGLDAAQRTGACGARHAVPQDDGGAHRVHRAGLHHRQRLEGLSGHRFRLRHPAAAGLAQQ